MLRRRANRRGEPRLADLQLFTQATVACAAALRSGNASRGLSFKDLRVVSKRGDVKLAVKRRKGDPTNAAEQLPLVVSESRLCAVRWLRRYCLAFFGLKLETLIRDHGSWPMFPKRRGPRGQWVRWQISALNKQLRSAALDAGVPARVAARLSMHGGRHYFISRGLAAGCIIARFSGHRSLGSMRPYMQRSWRQLLYWAEQLQP